MDDVSGLADKSNNFSNCLTVSQIYFSYCLLDKIYLADDIVANKTFQHFPLSNSVRKHFNEQLRQRNDKLYPDYRSLNLHFYISSLIIMPVIKRSTYQKKNQTVQHDSSGK